jgi:hypothetical protein
MIKSILSWFVNFFQSKNNILPPENTPIESLKDELIGIWTTSYGSDGGFSMVSGFGIQFKENNKAIDMYWGMHGEEFQEIDWTRISERKILLKFKIEADNYESEPADDWEEVEIEYDMINFTDGYGISYLQLVEKGSLYFWHYPEPIYKQ